ncbi:MAG TPA: trehalose-6-phosphate synthase [Acidimicrobiales bacterium]|nr:trehalose-6-phosphate synthase [Acidimicrobiales bacterium]
MDASAGHPLERPVVIVSNRGPVRFEVDEAGVLQSRRGAGGLVSGIAPLIGGTDATWLAAAMGQGDRVAAERGVVEADGLRVRLLSIDPETYRLAYDVVSNGVLWFAHHGLWDLTREPAFDSAWPAAWDAYRRLNHTFADAVAASAPEGAAVLIQDYHLCLVAEPLRAQRPDLATVHFSHTPFAPPVWLEALPDAAVVELLTGMAAHDACGFHTEQWAADFRESSRHLADVYPVTFVSPLASDPEDIRAAANSPACATALASLEERVGDRAVIGRVDRVELSKNLLRGFLAFGDLLERYPEHRERVVFVAGAYPSREGVPAYAAYRADVEAAVAAVNDRWGTADWTPIVLHVEDDFPRSVALLRRADVLLVNPIRDGLNLVASEGALVNDRHAVLALSPEAGAWERLHPGALRVPPFDVAGTANVLHRALTMAPEERERRHRALRDLAEARTPRHWMADQLAAARLAGR